MADAPIGKRTLNQLLAGETLSRDAAATFMQAVLDEEVGPEQLSASLGALRARGETNDEFMGFLDVLFEHAIRVPYDGDLLIDTCGTGGDGLGTFNVSTAAAIVVAAAGVPVAKHGNRSVSSRSGSADVLEAAGIPITGNVDALAAALDRHGLVFLFAPYHHPALKVVAPVRKALGVMTVFNLLGPQVNPAPLTHQIVGVPNLDFWRRYGKLFYERGLPAYVVHGREGADEALPGGNFHLMTVDPAADGPVESEIIPLEHGSESYPMSAFEGGDASDNAKILWAVLGGGGPAGIAEAIILNAGLALHLTKQEPTLGASIRRARQVLESGEPAKLLRAYRDMMKAAAQ